MEILKQSLRLTFGAPLRRRLEAFWSWWSNELRATLPQSMQHAFFSGALRLYLQLEGSDLVIRRGTSHNVEQIARYPFDPSTPESAHPSGVGRVAAGADTLVVCLPDNQVLTKTLSLPLAAEENLREVLSFEMDRQTPFTADQIYYDYTVVARNPGNRTISVNLVLAPRRSVDELLKGLTSHGLVPDLITTHCAETGEHAAVNLLPVQQRRRKTFTPRLVNVALGTLALLLLFATVSMPLLNKHHVIQMLEPRLQAAAGKAEVAHRLQEKVNQLTAESRFMVEMKLSSLSVLEIMDELTRLLPDDTWINRLEVKGGEIQIQGQSSSAASLIPLIESSPALHNPRFRSPVTKSPRSNMERFHLSADTQEAIL